MADPAPIEGEEADASIDASTLCLRCRLEPAVELVDFGAGLLMAMCTPCSALARAKVRRWQP
jgi:hypothetical protein